MVNTGKDTPKKLCINKGNVIFFILFLVTAGLTIWTIEIYRLTIINLKYILVIGALGAIIGLLFLYFSLKSNYSGFWRFLLSIAIGSGVFIFGFLFLNQKFADNSIESYDFNIIKTGTLGRGKMSHCSKPYAVIDFKGVEKELIFHCEYEQTIKNYSKITLTYSRGLFRLRDNQIETVDPLITAANRGFALAGGDKYIFSFTNSIQL